MSTAQAKTSPDPLLWVVAAGRHDALRLGGELDAAGLKNSVTTDLGQALAADPEVVVIDPTGWEESCRQVLEDRNGHSTLPPAVLFHAADDSVLCRAGPAFGFVSSAGPSRQLAAMVVRARRAFQDFRNCWPTPLNSPTGAERDRIKELLVRCSGLEIRADRDAALSSALRRRMLARLIPRVRDYVELLERSRGPRNEIELLAQLLVIGETYFWRYAGQFQSLQSILIPQLIARRAKDERRLRVWSAGCSTGEEVYSLVIACREALPMGWRVTVRGTDIDHRALTHAERGIYGERALRNLPRPLQRKYLQVTAGEAQVTDELKSSATFEFLNLGDEGLERWVTQTGPFDAIFCRNTLIYFTRRDVERVVSVFRRALVPGGGLFLGASETIKPQQCRLEPVRAKGSFYFRKPHGEPRRGEDPLSASTPRDPLEVKLAELYGLGIARAEAEDFVGAAAVFEEIVTLRPRDARGHTGLGLLLANQGREQEAVEHLEQAEKAEPSLAETSYLLGLVRERSGHDIEALQHYDIALQRDPHFFMAHVNRAWILNRLGRRERFLSEMRAAFSILRQKPRVTRWVTGGLGWEALLDLVTEALSCEGERE